MSSDAVKFSPTLKLGKPLSALTAEEVHAAAAAAIRKLPAGSATLFFSESDESSGATPEDKDPNPDTPGTSSKASSGVVAESPPASSPPATDNPLAGILSYSDDESSGLGEDSPRVGADRKQELPFADQVKMFHAQHDDAPQQTASPLKTKEPARDVLDAEVASFMSELESNGLLVKAEAVGKELDKDANEPQLAATATTSVAVSSGLRLAENASGADTAPAAGAIEAAAADNEPAEQRTLGRLAEAPDWCKVLDTSSGKAYFWNVRTNEVLWEPPAGLIGDALVPFEDAAMETAAAGDTVAETGDMVNQSVPLPDSAQAPKSSAAVKPQTEGTDGLPAGTPGPNSLTSLPSSVVSQRQHDEAAATTAPGQSSQQVAASHQDVQAVFLTLLQELRGPPQAQQLLQELPEAVRLTLQLELLHQQWQAFAAQQAATAGGDKQSASGFCWVTYELYVMHKLQQAVQRLQPAVKELEQQGQRHQRHQSLAATADSATAGSSVPGGAARSAVAKTAVNTAPDAEEGEIEASDDDVDMEVDDGETQQQQPTSNSTSGTQGAAKSYTASQQGNKAAKAGYTAAGTYTSTADMPSWAQPTYHYDFHSTYGGYYSPHAYQLYDAAYAQQYDPTYASQYLYGSQVAAAYDVSGAAAAAAGVPPLPAEAPPPLPAEADPQPRQQPPPLPPDDLCGDAATTTTTTTATAAAAAATKPKRKQYVAQPVRNTAATAGITQDVWHTGGLFAAAAEAGSFSSASVSERVSTPPLPSADAAGAEVRKRSRDHDSKGPLAGVTGAKPAKAAKMSALFNKWATVKQQQEEEEAERQRRAELAADPEYQEQKRQQQLERWRQQQLQSGAAEDNPNFTPLATDWRAQLGLQEAAATTAVEGDDPAAAKAARKAARKAAKAAAKKAAEATGAAAASRAVQWPTNSKVKPDLDALSLGLPAGWIAMWDKASGDIYYGNPATKETSWERP